MYDFDDLVSYYLITVNEDPITFAEVVHSFEK